MFGSSRTPEGSPDYARALSLGREIGRRGATVVCGGGAGIMEAACRGAAETGGGRIGVVLAGRGPANAEVAEAVVARDLGERLRLLRDLSDAWVFFPHGLGTMLELVWIAESVIKGEAPARPLLLVGEFWRGTLDLALREAAIPDTSDALRGAIRYVSVPEEATAIIFG